MYIKYTKQNKTKHILYCISFALLNLDKFTLMHSLPCLAITWIFIASFHNINHKIMNERK